MEREFPEDGETSSLVCGLAASQQLFFIGGPSLDGSTNQPASSPGRVSTSAFFGAPLNCGGLPQCFCWGSLLTKMSSERPHLGHQTTEFRQSASLSVVGFANPIPSLHPGADVRLVHGHYIATRIPSLFLAGGAPTGEMTENRQSLCRLSNDVEGALSMSGIPFPKCTLTHQMLHVSPASTNSAVSVMRQSRYTRKLASKMLMGTLPR